MANYYSVLGVAIDAAPDEIKRRYKKLALQFHPDKTGNPGDTERFHLIQEAYDTLKDSTLRRQYDSKNNIHQAAAGYGSHANYNGTHANYAGGGFTYSSYYTQSGGGGYGNSYFSRYQQNLRAYTDAYARSYHSAKANDRWYSNKNDRNESDDRSDRNASDDRRDRYHTNDRPESRYDKQYGRDSQAEEKSSTDRQNFAKSAAQMAQMAMQQELERRRREYMEAAARERAKATQSGNLYSVDGDDRAYQQAKQRAHARHYTVYEVSESDGESPEHDPTRTNHSGATAEESDSESRKSSPDDVSDSESEDSEAGPYFKLEYDNFKQQYDASDARGYDLAEPIVVEDEDEDTFHDANPPMDNADTSFDNAAPDSPEVVDLDPASPLRRPRLASQNQAFFEHRSLGRSYAANGNKRTKFAGMGDLRASLGVDLDDLDFGDMRLTLPETPLGRKTDMGPQPSAKRAKVAGYTDGHSRAQTLFTPVNKEFRRTSSATISAADLSPDYNEAALVFKVPPPRIDTTRPLTAERWATHVDQLQKYEREFAAYRQAVFQYQLGRLEKDERHHNIIYSDTSCLDVFQSCLFNDILLLQNYTRALQEFKDTLRQFGRDSAAVNAMTT